MFKKPPRETTGKSDEKKLKKLLYTKEQADAVLQEIQDFVAMIEKRDGNRFTHSVGIAASIICYTDSNTIGEHPIVSGSIATLERVGLHAIRSISEKVSESPLKVASFMAFKALSFDNPAK